MTSLSFPLPGLQKTLSAIRSDIYSGRGFATLRGLDISQFTPDDLATVYLGLTSYVAERRGKQNQQGTMMSTNLMLTPCSFTNSFCL